MLFFFSVRPLRARLGRPGPGCLTACPSARHRSALAAAPAPRPADDPYAHLAVPAQTTFEALGIRHQLVLALQGAFPNVRHPTEMQCELIPAILSGKDVLLKDATGSGKSFGILLALLNMPRIAKPDRALVDAGGKPAINSIFVVPHRDLAFQLLHWAERIASALTPHAPLASISSLAHAVVRGAATPVAAQLARLHADPPHVLIGTPQALLELHAADAQALQFGRVSTVVVDEVDYLIESAPSRATEFQRNKLRRKMERHPPATQVLLDTLFAGRPKETRMLAEQDVRQMSQSKRRVLRPPVQMIVSSATLRNHLKTVLFAQEGWLMRPGEHLARVTGASVPVGQAEGVDGLGGTGILHSVLLVSNSNVKNIEGAVEPPPSSASSETADESVPLLDDGGLIPPPEDILESEGPRKPLPFGDAVIETIATAFVLDVPRVALLVVPATAPVQSVVAELRQVGVNAHGLDLLAEDKGRAHLLRGPSDVAIENPTLLVSTLASTRGLDLPELSHVFVVGVPEGRRTDSYLHVAGRVGRFGRGGKVVTILEEVEVEVEGAPKLEQKRMVQILEEIGAVPTRFEHFD